MTERKRHGGPDLPPELAEYLGSRDVASVLTTTGEGTTLVILAPDPELASIVGGVPIGVAPELHLMADAPVIRLVTRFFDVPDDPIAFEAFIDPGDPAQREQFRAITDQEGLPIHLYNHALHRVDRRELPISEDRTNELGRMLAQAEAWIRSIPRGAYDFAEAKEQVIAVTKHPELPYRSGGVDRV